MTIGDVTRNIAILESTEFFPNFAEDKANKCNLLDNNFYKDIVFKGIVFKDNNNNKRCG